MPDPPHPVSTALGMVFGAVALLFGAVFGLIPVLNVVLLPLWFVFIASAVGVMARRASMWRCPVCHAEMFPTEEQIRARTGRRHGARRGSTRGPAGGLVPHHGT